MATPKRAIPPGIRNPSRRQISNKNIGDRVIFTHYSTETSNQNFFRIRCIVKPGGGVPLHYHRNSCEHFKTLKGVLTVINGDKTLSLKEGEDALVPVNTNHLFRNDSSEDCEFEGTVGWNNCLKTFTNKSRPLWNAVSIQRSCSASSNLCTYCMG